MIKGMKHMYAIDQSKLRESKIFSSLRNLQNLFSSKGLVKINVTIFTPDDTMKFKAEALRTWKNRTRIY